MQINSAIADDTMMPTPEYRQFVEELKARVTAARSANRDMILLYWDIGRKIVEKQKTLGWGESVIVCISADLQEAFPATTGFSPRNLRSMKQFYLAYFDPTIWLQVVAKLGRRSKDYGIWRQPVAKLTDRKGIEFMEQLVQKFLDVVEALVVADRPSKYWNVPKKSFCMKAVTSYPKISDN